MPLFEYKCTECGEITERYMAKLGDDDDVVCEECGCTECEKIFSTGKSKEVLNARDNLEKNIAPDAKRIMDKMMNGGTNEFLDIYGDE